MRAIDIYLRELYARHDIFLCSGSDFRLGASFCFWGLVKLLLGCVVIKLSIVVIISPLRHKIYTISLLVYRWARHPRYLIVAFYQQFKIVFFLFSFSICLWTVGSCLHGWRVCFGFLNESGLVCWFGLTCGLVGCGVSCCWFFVRYSWGMGEQGGEMGGRRGGEEVQEERGVRYVAAN